MKNYTMVDGNTAAAMMAYQLSDMALIYPITPSSPMAENIDEWQASGKKNIFGNTVRVTEMQSEAGASGALHGALSSGALATTFTSSQGLLLMIPNMYKIAGELLPCVIHVAARTLATHALSIFGDHSDVMATRATGFAMLCSSSVQEAQDFSLASHLTTLKSRIPFLHFFDGFRTSHEINKIEEITQEEILKLVDFDVINKFRVSAISSDNPTQKGTAQNGDIFFQNREACNSFYNMLPQSLEETFKDMYKVTGRKYNLFDYEGPKDATDIIIAMGSGTETISETVKTLNDLGRKVGLIRVRLFRPFSAKHLISALPKTTEIITVLDRTKESGAVGEPLYIDVCSALYENGMHIPVIGGRYGLSSKDFNPDQVLAIYDNMLLKNPKNHFTVGINDDITCTSIPVKKHINTLPKGTIECKFYGLGSDGTVSANKNSIKIIGDTTPLNAQAYFQYDSKKSGGITISHLRFGREKIKSTYLCANADLIACHNKEYVKDFDILHGIKKNGVFLLNSPWTLKDMEKEFPAKLKNEIAKNNVRVFNIDANKIADEVGLGRRINLIMQSAFFKLANIIPFEEAKQKMKEAAYKSYSKKGDAIVKMNYDAIDLADGKTEEVIYPSSWKTTTDGANKVSTTSDPYFNEVIKPILEQNGDNLPVSAFTPNGEVPTGTTQYEKRNIALEIPEWIKENCIQCNQCSLVCPHGCIRPYLVDADSPISKKVGAVKALGIAGKDFKIQVSPKDCTGCENCVHVCPALKKALAMRNKEEIIKEEEKNYNLLKDIENPETIFKCDTVKGSQFKKPLFEFSGACAGCGETPYVKLLSQLFGDHMIVANATGCSSIYSGSNPTCPYTKNSKNHGPAWINSLFEDNAEFGLGMYLAHKNNIESLEHIFNDGLNLKLSPNLKQNIKLWLENKNNRNDELAEKLRDGLKKENKSEDNIKFAKDALALTSAMTKKSFWLIGGDGWAYDIGYSGIDHALASNENIKILVLDTEVYSNTGGQASKSTPMGSSAKFASSGKGTHKKDLGYMAMAYPNVYVASCSMGANQAQLVKAITEAEAHNGPAIIICYSTCINHGMNMSESQSMQKEAVTSGYWPLYRYNPDNEQKLTIDPPFATTSYRDFALKQSRYANVAKKYPEKSAEMLEKAEKIAKEKVERLKNLKN